MMLIVNADDFGSCSEVNEAVERARRDGVLTSASLMVTGEAVEEAVSIAHSDPGLAVGLHLALSDARSVLPPAEIPRIVDSDSRFGRNPAACAWLYYVSRTARRQVRAEVEAQFEAFARTGLPFSHVDGHHHLHAHPVVMPAVVEMAEKYGAMGIRVPREPFISSLRIDCSRVGPKTITALGHAYLGTVCERALRGSGLSTCDFSIGAMMSGAMNVDYVVGILSGLGAGNVEVFFHPSVCVPLGPNAGDLETLLSEGLRELIAGSGYTLATYADLKVMSHY